MSFNVRLWITKRHNFWLSKTFGLDMTDLKLAANRELLIVVRNVATVFISFDRNDVLNS